MLEIILPYHERSVKIDHNDTQVTSESQHNKIKSCSLGMKPVTKGTVAISISTKYNNKTAAVRTIKITYLVIFFCITLLNTPCWMYNL